jgi:hypothetical protein
MTYALTVKVQLILFRILLIIALDTHTLTHSLTHSHTHNTRKPCHLVIPPTLALFSKNSLPAEIMVASVLVTTATCFQTHDDLLLMFDLVIVVVLVPLSLAPRISSTSDMTTTTSSGAEEKSY